MVVPWEEGASKEETVYAKRFSEIEDRVRQETWKVLVEDFFQQYVLPTDTVLDLGAGDGNFIKNIRARKRLAVDISPHVLALRQEGIETIQAPATQLSDSVGSLVDVVFMSNFLEHMPHKSVAIKVLEECYSVLKPGGKVLVLQPNIRYTGAAYWDYSDHHIPLTEHSLVEMLEVCGFEIEKVVPRFLPYTVKSRIGKLAGPATVRLYLKCRMLWRLFGQQTFVVAYKPS
ncbi:MAG: class I SAM-dependent methyltransferase [Deltaproteobacteria bacterium]|nr:class I SAM-dependent methyltransferase [Deltaproteobacteria bacterium]